MNNPLSTSSKILVSPHKSSRLAAMRNKSVEKIALDNKVSHLMSADLKPEQKQLLNQTISVVDDKLMSILNSYPSGKKNSFFKLKFGISTQAFKEISLKSAFDLLALDSARIRNFKRIENRDCYGKIMG